MRVFYDFDNVSQITRPVVTIGSYDGVHTGHREILSAIRQIAKERNGESVVITFYPHPRQVLKTDPEVALLNSLEEKLALLESVGIDNVIVVQFTPEFSQLGSQDFVEHFLVGALHIDTLMVGFNHHLGHNKDGDPHSLLSLSRKFGFRLQEMPRRDVNGEKVSSTLIREFIRNGKMEKAARYLGANYAITGCIDGDNRIQISELAKLLPPPGEYQGTMVASSGSGSETGAKAGTKTDSGSEAGSGTGSEAGPIPVGIKIDSQKNVWLCGREARHENERITLFFDSDRSTLL